MKMWKELGLLVIGGLVVLVIISVVNFNTRLKNLEMAHNNLVAVLSQGPQRQMQQMPKPAAVPAPAPAASAVPAK